MSNNGGEDITRRGNEWEVVALTESTYAAAPGPNQDSLNASGGGFIGGENSETPGALFLSGHFGVAASTHENLLLDPEEKLKPDEAAGSELEESGGKLDHKDEGNLHIEGLLSDEFHDSPKLSVESNILSFYNSGSGDVESSNLMEKEHSIYEEAAASISSLLSEGSGVSDLHESPRQPLNLEALNPPKAVESDEIEDEPTTLPSGSWWGRQVLTFYELVKTVDPFWSVVVAATAVGLIIIGHRWCKDKTEVLHISSRYVTSNEGTSLVVFPMAQLKEVNWHGKHGPHINLTSFVQH